MDTTDDYGDPYDQRYAAEYWRLDAEALQRFYELCPEAQGESISLGDLDALCRLMGRPIRDDNEQFQLMSELDTTNQMIILRHDFVTWLLQDLTRERELEAARLHVRENRAASVAEAVWEEIIVDTSGGDDAAATGFDPPSPSRYYYNVVTGESKWELPSFVQCLWSHVVALEARRAAMVSEPTEALLRDDDHPSNVEMLQDLRAVFLKYDDDGSGALDSAEFEDLCVAIGQSLSTGGGATAPLRTLMREVDPFSAYEVVTWDALSHYWTSNAPYQRRTKLQGKYASWEQVDVLHKKNLPVSFRQVDTFVERWNHPEMEQSVVALLLKVVPSTKLDWSKKVALFFDAQLDAASADSSGVMDAVRGGASSSKADSKQQTTRSWNLSQCGRVLLQLGHPMTRRRHLEAAVQQIRSKFGTSSSSSSPTELHEDTVTAWFLYCVRKVEMNGWEELVDSASGQVYYYHEVSGTTQWDAPEMGTHMTQFLSKFGGGAGSSDERLTRIFRHYDVDESGSISFDEFRKFYRALVLGTSGATAPSSSSSSPDADELKIRQIFRMLDTGGDGSVSLDEFKVWWRTKLQLEEDETEDAKQQRRLSQRRELCLSFLENADALIVRDLDLDTADVKTADESRSLQLLCFESNLLPRLVGVLGKYPLKGLAYRKALTHLVKDALSQEVQLNDFLAWYDGFEAAEREREAVEEAKARAQAEVLTQELKVKARAKEKQLKAKRRLKLAAKETPQSADDAGRKRIETLFRAFDANGSGFLDEKELQQLTKALGHEMDSAQVRQMMHVMDTSGDGQVTLDEFVTFWTAFQRAESSAKTRLAKGSSSAASTAPEAPPASPLKSKKIPMTAVDASASLSVSFEMAKTRVLKFSLDDFRDALGDWKDELADKRDEKKKTRAAAETALQEKRRRSVAFIPTRRRRYGTSLDVTWIEPEVVECMADVIRCVTLATRPLLRPDAAQTIQTLARSYVTRQRVRRRIEARFLQHVDLHTKHYYYVDRETGSIALERPLFKFERVSSVAPFELDDCDVKCERYVFQKQQHEMSSKKQFFERNKLAVATSRGERPLFVPAAFYLYDVSRMVHERLLGAIWAPLRCHQRDFALIELIATRHRRQLQQRSSDGAAYLPLHYAVRHFDVFPLRVVRAIARGFVDALRAVDAFGMTPLHLALRERRSSVDLVRLLAGSAASIWEATTKCGDTPLHVAVLHRAPIELMRWILSSHLVSAHAIYVLNAHGVSPFHLAVRLFSAHSKSTSTCSSASYAKALVLAFLKHFDVARLCGLRTKQGDLPLHLAIDAFETSAAPCDDHVWLTQLLWQRYPAALLIRRASNGLLPIHLAIKYRLPPAVVASMWQATLAESKSSTAVLEWTMIQQTRTTLLHYAVLHQPHALELVRSIVDAMPEACSMQSTPNDDLPLHMIVSSSGSGNLSTSSLENNNGEDDVLTSERRRCHVVRLLCERYAAGCQVYNRQGRLPIHVALANAQSVEIVRTLIEFAPFVLATNKQERNGLRALVLAASAKNASYAVLLELLALTPSVKITSQDVTKRRASVTPLYAISARPFHRNQLDGTAATAAARRKVVGTFSTKFEQIEDEDTYFLAMARAKLRRKHHCPTADWEFRQILRLIDLNPLDEAVVQRALLATSSKLQTLAQATTNEPSESISSPSPQAESSAEAAVAAVALDPELAIVHRVHQVLYEFPANARVQVIGQSVLRKLLPTAFAKAAYRAKIDPYFNL